ncbi:DHA2 family efflux MFS transporter permease subunit [Niallia taxi]|uniref:DHA2 family efflux MFS transporter permease subunit n=1 Tax=Niallia taxi TaxID=2499688 RepID=A0A3S2TWQ0_9BACI|nr:DHA2 family efflux MFS transporter permease subunit [Niallia taxi]MED4036903.1 DHA2 family efflux MFS transporter permease subunit [Niallia taxi]RVT67515.1 DHA2 family efflux MFS transporter permease subunit [Niallia taxi]
MTIYIASYAVISIILLLTINYLIRKQSRKPKQEKVSNTSKDEPIQENEISHSSIAQEESPMEEAINETLSKSAITEPALEYVSDPDNAERHDENEIPVKEKDIKQQARVDFEGSKGKIIAAVMLGAFVAILNQTLLNVAIPHIMNDLNVSTSTVQWLTTGYMLTNGVFIPITPFLISKLGTRKLLILAMSAFTIGSLVCSVSTGFSMLMIGRVIQAAGAGVIMPLLMTTFLTIFPPEKRGTAMGIMGVAMIFAPAIGPTLSGWLIGHYSWRVLFDLVIPFGIIDLIIATIWMKDVTPRTNPKFDLWGFVTSTIGLGFLLYGFSEAGNDGWDSGVVIGSLITGVVFLALFVWREFTTETPMLDLRVFKYDIYALTTVVSMVVNMAMFAGMILLPVYLQNIRGFTALDSGLLMLPGAIVMGIMSPIAGKLFDRFGARPLAIIGLVITVLTTWGFTQLTMQTTYAHIMMLYIFRMFGMSFIMMTVMTEGMNQLPMHLTSHGTAASNTARTVAGSIGTAFLVTVMTNRSTFHTANYSNIITSDNPFIAEKLGQLGQGFAALAGIPSSSGQALAVSTIYGKAVVQATINGINDAFIVATGISALALLLAFFIRRSTPRKVK